MPKSIQTIEDIPGYVKFIAWFNSDPEIAKSFDESHGAGRDISQYLREYMEADTCVCLACDLAAPRKVVNSIEKAYKAAGYK